MSEFVESPIFSVLIAVGCLASIIVWISYINGRFAPWVRHKLGVRWGVTIEQQIGLDNGNWKIKGKHTRQQGCWVTIAQFTVQIGCLVLPALGILTVAVLIYMTATEG